MSWHVQSMLNEGKSEKFALEVELEIEREFIWIKCYIKFYWMKLNVTS
jgi:hypothetical protein